MTNTNYELFKAIIAPTPFCYMDELDNSDYDFQRESYSHNQRRKKRAIAFHASLKDLEKELFG